MKCTIFYSWQSDLPNKDNRSFIENCIEKAIKKDKLGFEAGLTIAVDRDTKKTVGTPDIAGTIFDKIAKTDIFICDISIINGNASVPILTYCWNWDMRLGLLGGIKSFASII